MTNYRLLTNYTHNIFAFIGEQGKKLSDKDVARLHHEVMEVRKYLKRGEEMLIGTEDETVNNKAIICQP